jgi:hypothetical protein
VWLLPLASLCNFYLQAVSSRALALVPRAVAAVICLSALAAWPALPLTVWCQASSSVNAVGRSEPLAFVAADAHIQVL